MVSLLGLVDSLLQGEEVGGEECGEAELVAWAGALLNTHYLQLVVSKEEQTREAVARLQVCWILFFCLVKGYEIPLAFVSKFYEASSMNVASLAQGYKFLTS